jgi:hypothetical protein
MNALDFLTKLQSFYILLGNNIQKKKIIIFPEKIKK